MNAVQEYLAEVLELPHVEISLVMRYTTALLEHLANGSIPPDPLPSHLGRFGPLAETMWVRMLSSSLPPSPAIW